MNIKLLLTIIIIFIYGCSTDPASDVAISTETGNRIIETEVVDVTNPATGQVWMDRNLGASRAAISSTDEEAYGYLYQWGRASDGHQLRNSGTTSTFSSNDVPGHGDFIKGLTVWLSPQNDELWQDLNGINNPCPDGYRLPTSAELETERQSWSSNNAEGAFASPLKWTLAGYRGHSNGSLVNVSSGGGYWSSDVESTDAQFLYFHSSTASIYSGYRAGGLAVRCTKN